MSKGMLGNVPLSEFRGLRDDLEDKISGPNGEMWLAGLRKFLRKENPWKRKLGTESLVEMTVEVIVDYSMTFDDMVANGKYDGTHKVIKSEHFSVKGDGKRERNLFIVGFNGETAVDQINAEFEKCGLVHAKIEDLLAVGAQYPELQRNFLITALGTVWHHPKNVSSFCVASLRGDGVERCLDYRLYSGSWNNYCRFLAVAK